MKYFLSLLIFFLCSGAFCKDNLHQKILSTFLQEKRVDIFLHLKNKKLKPLVIILPEMPELKGKTITLNGNTKILINDQKKLNCRNFYISNLIVGQKFVALKFKFPFEGIQGYAFLKLTENVISCKELFLVENKHIDKTEKAIKQKKKYIVNLNLNKNTAIKLSEIVLVKKYRERVLKQRPWIVTDNETEFKIQGSTPKIEKSTNALSKSIYIGGVAEIIIRKSDAKVIHCMHGK